jgi:small-conductance mechanosensitive channel
MENTREQKAKIFDSLLLEHDKYSRELSQLKSNFNLTKDDEKKIKELEQKMEGVQRKAAGLGN